jgi:hypothetical protein
MVMEQGERLAREEHQAQQEAIKVSRGTSKDRVWLPNATPVSGRQFVDMKTKMNRYQYDFFTNDEKTKSLIKAPEAGYHYHWARNAQYDPITGMRVAMGLYKYVTPAEMKGESMTMLTNHKGTTGNQVGFGTLILVKQSAEAYRETHIEPQVEAVARLYRHEQEFQGSIDEHSKGRAQGTIEAEEEKEQVFVSATDEG